MYAQIIDFLMFTVHRLCSRRQKKSPLDADRGDINVSSFASTMSSPVVNHPQQRSETPEHFRTQSHSQKSQAASLAPLITQKRVLPIRHRRGGPVIGNCHIDLLIIETEKRESKLR